MESLLGCFKPRPERLSDSGLNSLITQKHSAIAAITGLTTTEISNKDDNSDNISANYDGLGVLMYPSLLLTTHTTIPSPAAAQDAEISLRYSETSLNILHRRFLPELFFATDPKLNVTVIACEFVNPEMHPLGLDTSKVEKTAYEVGSKVYVLGHDRNKVGPMKLSVGCGYIVTQLGTSIEVRSREEAWTQGSAGFDHHGNFAFIVTTHSDSDHSKALKTTCVSIHTIKSWLEPQWQATKTTDNTTLHPPRAPLYARRATFAAPESGTAIDSCVRAVCDKKKANDHGGKITHCSSELIHCDDKSSVIRTANGDEDDRLAPIKQDDVSSHGKLDPVKHDGIEDEGKLAAIKQEVIRKVTNLKGEESGKTSTTKVVEVGIHEALSRSRGANPNPNLEKAGQSTKLTVAVREEINKKKKGVANEGNKVHVDRRAKPSLHQAFQRDRRSLQLRLSDIPKDKALGGL